MPSSGFTVVVCGDCPAQIIWANTGHTMMPVNEQPVPGGNVVLVRRAVGSPTAIVTTDPAVYPDLPRRTSHMADLECPAAAAAAARRGSRKNPARAARTQTETLF